MYPPGWSGSPGTVPVGSIETGELADLAVTAAKIALDTITASQIAANAVAASELADNAVDTAALADDAVTAAKIGDAELKAIAGLTSAADKGIQFTGSGTAATYDLTTAGKNLLDDADAAAQRVTMGAQAVISWQPQGTFPTFGQLTHFEWFEHFLNIGDGLSGLVADVSGTGAVVSAGTVAVGRLGVIDCHSGTDATGRAAIAALASTIVLGSGRVRFRADAKVGTLSDGSNTYTVRVGLLDSSSAEPTDGCYFRYTHSVNSAKWQCVSRANSVETATATDSGVLVSTADYSSFEIEVNAAATSVTFYIGGVLVGTHAANIPSGGARATGLGGSIIKSLGAQDRELRIDLFALSFEPTAPL